MRKYKDFPKADFMSESQVHMMCTMAEFRKSRPDLWFVPESIGETSTLRNLVRRGLVHSTDGCRDDDGIKDGDYRGYRLTESGQQFAAEVFA